MKPKKRLKPLSSSKEIFRIPTIIYFPAFLVSLAVAVLSFFAEPFSTTYLAGGIISTLLFAALIFFGVILPAMHASTLKRDGVSGTAKVIKNEKRSRLIGTLEPDNRVRVSSIVITFEFSPEGSTFPLLLEADVERVTASMQEGKTMRITYSKANPRIVELPGE